MTITTLEAIVLSSGKNCRANGGKVMCWLMTWNSGSEVLFQLLLSNTWLGTSETCFYKCFFFMQSNILFDYVLPDAANLRYLVFEEYLSLFRFALLFVHIFLH